MGLLPEFDGKKMFLILFTALVFIQIGARIFNQIWNTMDLNLGWAFQLVMIFLTILLAYNFIVQRSTSTMTTKDMIMMILLVGILLAGFVFLPKYMPQIFGVFPEASRQWGVMP
jgi:nitrate reductase gamma subunit